MSSKNLRFLIFILTLLPSLAGAGEARAGEARTGGARADETAFDAYQHRSDRATDFVFKKAPTHLGHDVAATFSGLPLAIWGTGGLISGMSEAADQRVQRYFSNNDPLGDSIPLFNQLGAFYSVGGISLMTFCAGTLLHDPKLSRLGETFIESLLLTETFTLGLKFVAERERPDQSDNRSFPSAHASGTFALATDFAIAYGPWWSIPAYSLAGLVSVARMDDNKHFLSDVIFGATIGTAFAAGTSRFHRQGDVRTMVTPVVQDGRVGLEVRHLF